MTEPPQAQQTRNPKVLGSTSPPNKRKMMDASVDEKKQAATVQETILATLQTPLTVEDRKAAEIHFRDFTATTAGQRAYASLQKAVTDYHRGLVEAKHGVPVPIRPVVGAWIGAAIGISIVAVAGLELGIPLAFSRVPKPKALPGVNSIEANLPKPKAPASLDSVESNLPKGKALSQSNFPRQQLPKSAAAAVASLMKPVTIAKPIAAAAAATAQPIAAAVATVKPIAAAAAAAAPITKPPATSAILHIIKVVGIPPSPPTDTSVSYAFSVSQRPLSRIIAFKSMIFLCIGG